MRMRVISCPTLPLIIGLVTGLLFFTAAAQSAKAQDAPTDSAASSSDSSGDESLPDIQAKTHQVSVIRVSQSQRVYLLQYGSADDDLPPVGKILLLKTDDSPVMAFRVLKDFPDSRDFAAKRVRRYNGPQVLDAGSQYLGVEKVSDLVPPPPSEQDKKDVQELDDIQTGKAPPRPPKSVNANQLDADDESESRLGITLDEINPLDNNTQWLSAQIGLYRNSDNNGNDGAYYTGAGLRYGLALKKKFLLKKAKVQDALILEGGFALYKIYNLAGTNANDVYTVLPVTVTLRYDVLLGENFTLFGYAGFMHNTVIATQSSTQTLVDDLNSTLPAFGVGLMFAIGPDWDARFDLGYDVLGLGIVLRF